MGVKLEDMDIDLTGKTAIVTGGGSGIGRAISLALAEKGMYVLICGRHADKLTATASAVPGQISSQVCDLQNPEEIEALFETAKSWFSSLYLLVNNVAIGLYSPIESVTVEDWDTSMNVNARGAFLCAREAFVWMQEKGGGRIVNIASVVARKGYENQASYTASKHAMLGFTKVMAREGQKSSIRCSAVCPGGVDTELVRNARPDIDPEDLIQPDDVARAVLYLATEPESCATDCINLRRPGSTPFA